MSIFILYPFRSFAYTAFHSGGNSFVVCGIAYFCICSPVRSLTVDLSVAGEFLMSFPSVRKTIHTVLACGGAIFCDAFFFHSQSAKAQCRMQDGKHRRTFCYPIYSKKASTCNLNCSFWASVKITRPSVQASLFS